MGGTFVLRIEDTDEQRSSQELVDNILRSLEWLGIDWDEGPLRQSERRERHAEAIETLMASGQAYEDDGAIRFRTPADGVTVCEDVVRGRVEWENADLADPVIRRSDGTPMFVLANAVDDIDMGITHAIRGEDLLNTVPIVLLLMRALRSVDANKSGMSLSHAQDLVYAHLPLLVNEQRKKLSKRRDDVAMEDYRDRGYLPAAFANYLATLGWGTSDEVEIRPMTEIIELFRLEDVNKSAAFFDVKKLTAFNAEYIRALSPADFVATAQPWLEADPPWPADRFSPAAFEAIVPAIQERVKTMDEVPGLVDWLFLEDPVVDDAAWQKIMVDGPNSAAILDDAMAAYAEVDWLADQLHSTLLAVGEKHEMKLGKTQAPVRMAVTGRSVGPPLFESVEILGREETLRRLKSARSKI